MASGRPGTGDGLVDATTRATQVIEEQSSSLDRIRFPLQWPTPRRRGHSSCACSSTYSPGALGPARARTRHAAPERSGRAPSLACKSVIVLRPRLRRTGRRPSSPPGRRTEGGRLGVAEAGEPGWPGGPDRKAHVGQIRGGDPRVLRVRSAGSSAARRWRPERATPAAAAGRAGGRNCRIGPPRPSGGSAPRAGALSWATAAGFNDMVVQRGHAGRSADRELGPRRGAGLGQESSTMKVCGNQHDAVDAPVGRGDAA